MTDRSERAKHLGMTEAEYDDLQVWIRHGRVGVGRTYQQEVDRARRIEAERSREADRQPNTNEGRGSR